MENQTKEVKKKEPLYRSRPWFSDFHKRKQRFAIMLTGRRVGKTVATIVDSIMFAYNSTVEDTCVVYVAPFKEQARDVAWRYYMKYTEGLNVRVKESALKITFLHNNATIELKGGKSKNAHRGRYYNYVILDEVAQMDYSFYSEIIRPTVADKEGKVVFIGTVKGRNSFWQLYKSMSDPIYKDDWFSKMIKITDTTAISAKEIEALRREMKKGDFEAEMLCNPDAEVDGTFYGEEMFHLFSSGRFGDFPYNPAFPVSTYWDLGFVDSVVIIFVQFYDDKIYVIDYYKNAQKVITHYLDIVRSKDYRYKQHYFPHDAKARTLSANSVTLIETIEQTLSSDNITVLEQHKVLDGINAARLALRKTYFHAPTTEKLAEALQLYRREYDSAKGEYKNKEFEDWTNHGADAFRYLALNYTAVKSRVTQQVDLRTKLLDSDKYTLNKLYAENIIGHTNKYVRI